MAAHVPFVNTVTDCTFAAGLYGDSEFLRVPLERIDGLRSALPTGPRLWIDCGVDGFHRPFVPLEGKSDRLPGWKWRKLMRRFSNFQRLADESFQSKPIRSEVEAFVEAILGKCMEYEPAALTVPQLPIVNNTSRNRINKVLAAATAKWRTGANFRGKLILPAVFTNQKQLNQARTKRQTVLLDCYKKAEADGLWTVDSSLSDQSGSRTFREIRFPALIKFHEEIAEKLPPGAIKIAGPYWGMNLVLWARGLCDYPAIGLGSAYQYHIAGGVAKTALIRLAIPPLRRWVLTGADFKKWLVEAVGKIGPADNAYIVLDDLRRDCSSLSAVKELARRQIAQFYKQWCDEIESAPLAGRALALYQMLSSAYVLGKTLPTLPAGEKTARRPERVVEYLMLNCL